MNLSQVGRRVWSTATMLKNDGVSYIEYVGQDRRGTLHLLRPRI